MERVICESDPAPLPGELGTIVQRAMHKDAARRYDTVEQFSEDIRRYLEGLPVLARKDTTLYRMGKFIRRNKFASAAAGIAVLSLATTAGLAVSQARRLQRHVDVVSALARTMLFDVNPQVAELPGSLKVRETLVRTGLQYLDALASEAGDDASVTSELAKGYVEIGKLQSGPAVGEPNFGDAEGARKSYQTALRLAEKQRVHDSKNREVLVSIASLHASLAELAGDPRDAIRHLEQSLEISAKLGNSRSPVDRTLASLADAYLRAGDPQRALEGARASGALRARHIEAAALAASGDLAAATAAERASIQREEASLAAASTEDLRKRVIRLGASVAHRGLADVLGNPFHPNLGEVRAAVREYQLALAHAEANTARDNVDRAAQGVLAFALGGLGASLHNTKPAESIARYRRSIEILDKLWNAGRPYFRTYLTSLAANHWQMTYPLRKLGRIDEAFTAARNAITLDPTAPAHNALGDLWLEAGDRDRAMGEYRRAMQVAEQEVAAKPHMMPLRQELADCYERLARYYAARSEWEQARDWEARSVRVWKEWGRWGVSSIYDRRRAAEAASRVVRYGRFLAPNTPE
jgi:tetratricopeptide (TPR) repeat protein